MAELPDRVIDISPQEDELLRVAAELGSTSPTAIHEKLPHLSVKAIEHRLRSMRNKNGLSVVAGERLVQALSNIPAVNPAARRRWLQH